MSERGCDVPAARAVCALLWWQQPLWRLQAVQWALWCAATTWRHAVHARTAHPTAARRLASPAAAD